MIKNYKKIISKIFYVSKISKSTNKKLSTLVVVLLANFSALLDVIIILSIAFIFSDNISDNKYIAEYLSFYEKNQYFLIVIVFLRFVTLFFQKIYTKKIELVVDNDIKNHLVSEVFDKNNFSISDSLFFVNVLSQHISFFYSSFVNFLVTLTQVLAYSVYLIMTQAGLLGYMLILVICLYPPLRFLFNLARKTMHESYVSSKEANNYIQNIIENIFLIKLYEKGKGELKKINDTLNERKKFLYKNEIYSTSTAILPSFMVFLIFSIVALSERILSLITIDFLGIVLRLFQSLSVMSTTLSRMVNSYVHIEELEKIDKNKQQINNTNFIKSPGDDVNIIEVKNVAFQYFNSNFQTFNNLSLQLKKNLHYLVTGANGVGKSTMLSLFAGVLIPSSGNVINRSHKTGYVGPNPLIIEGTLRENILFGNDQNIPDEKLISLIEEINLFESQEDIDLNIFLNNKSLSSGQMQKISFLRIFISKIDLLILDESTSNLDIESKNKIVNKIKSLEGITIINSTHEPELFDFYDGKITIDLFRNEKRVIVD